MNLIKLGEEARALEVQIEHKLEQSYGEITPEIEALMDELVELDMDQNGKLDKTVYVMRKLEQEAALLAERADAVKKASDAKSNAAKRIKSRLQYFMELKGIEKLEGDLWTLGIQSAGGKAPMEVDEVDLATLPPIYLRHREPELDKEAIRKVLEQGVELEFARLRERSKVLRVR